ncbi:MAG: DUF484 family protein [Pseudomonadota bacterium]
MQQDIQTLDNSISDDQVSEFLRKHPHFFEQHASLLSEIYLPSPHGNGAISLAERQQLAQRDKIRVLEVKLAQLIEFAEENDATSAKVHALSVKLLANQNSHPNFEALQQLIAKDLQQDFSVSQTQLHIWLKPHDVALAQNAAFTPVNEAFSDWAMTLNAPFCGTKPQLADNFQDAHLQSFAFIPLFKALARAQEIKHIFGVLILSAEEQHRFKANMGTLYLERIGSLVSAALTPYL